MTALLRPASPAPDSDADLVARSVAGDRDAFARLVARYQSLVCAVAFSATGSRATSEDLAQEAFITAWRQLPTLREPDRVRPWLCGIARMLAQNLRRKHGHEPSHDAQQIDAVAEVPDDDELPMDAAMREEESRILWSALGRVPVLYREPLVLFYREQQSVEAVADALDLNIAAVRQRLARGRRLLQEQVLASIEGALAKSAPGAAFTLAVVAALPSAAVSGSAAAAIGVGAAKSGVFAKSTVFSAVVAAAAGPLISLTSAVLAIRAGLDTARTTRERRLMLRVIIAVVAASIVFSAAVIAMIHTGPFWAAHPRLLAAVGTLMPLSFAWFFVRIIHTGTLASRRLRSEEALGADAAKVRGGYTEYVSPTRFLGLPLMHIRIGIPPQGAGPARGWIAVGDQAIGGLFAFGSMVAAPVCVGSVAVGGLAVGTIAFGVVPMGAVALGLYTLGTVAFGFFSVGAMAIGWHGAAGGLAIARDFAGGGYAIAMHANDVVARDALAQWLPSWLFLTLFGTLAVLAIVPIAWYARRVRRLARH